jgi:hypothetical protein
MAPPDLSTARPPSTRSVRPSPVLCTRSPTPATVLVTIRHAAPATCTPRDKQTRFSKRNKDKRKKNYPEFEFKPRQVNDSSQSSQGTDHLVSHSDSAARGTSGNRFHTKHKTDTKFTKHEGRTDRWKLLSGNRNRNGSHGRKMILRPATENEYRWHRPGIEDLSRSTNQRPDARIARSCGFGSSAFVYCSYSIINLVSSQPSD